MNEIVKNREKYEWVRLWWEDANDPDIPRILLIGDSITAGYRPLVNNMLRGTVVVDQLATSSDINDPVFLKQLKFMLAEYTYEIIHFNNGLHGWHVSESDYETSFEQIIKEITDVQDSCKLILATSTPVSKKGCPSELNHEKDIIIRSRNSSVSKIADNHGFPVTDLYKYILGKTEVRSPDAYHYTQDGYKILAEKVTSSIKSLIS